MDKDEKIASIAREMGDLLDKFPRKGNEDSYLDTILNALILTGTAVICREFPDSDQKRLACIRFLNMNEEELSGEPDLRNQLPAVQQVLLEVADYMSDTFQLNSIPYEDAFLFCLHYSFEILKNANLNEKEMRICLESELNDYFIFKRRGVDKK